MKTMTDLERDFKLLQEDYKKLDDQIPRIAGITAVKVFRQGILSGVDINGVNFVSRKPETDKAYDRGGKTYKGGKFSSSNPILKQIGNLFDGLKYTAEENIVHIGVDLNKVPYAQAHNEGLNNQPKRQYLGFTERLAEIIAKEIRRRRMKIFTKFQKGKDED